MSDRNLRYQRYDGKKIKLSIPHNSHRWSTSTTVLIHLWTSYNVINEVKKSEGTEVQEMVYRSHRKRCPYLKKGWETEFTRYTGRKRLS